MPEFTGETLNWTNAKALEAGYKASGFSPVDVARSCLAQIAARDGAIKAMSLVDERTTLLMAEASSKRWKVGEPIGPLDGIPVLIKDLLLVKGWPTKRGSKTTDIDQPWNQDAPCVARLREAGAVFMGMTATPEFGWKGVTDSPLTGITRNPWDLTKTPGGSSGGSSAALAAGYGTMAIGTDGGGSIRIPAAFTGTFGLKPSFGRVPAYPLSAFGTVAHVGPMARNVRDAALMLNEISKPDDRDWHALPDNSTNFEKASHEGIKALRIVFSPNLGYADVDPEIAELVRRAVDVLADLGAEITQADPGFEDPAKIFRTIWWGGARSIASSMSDEKKALLEPALADVIEQAQSITVEDVYEANRLRGQLGSQMRQFMAKYDALITPALPIPAFKAGELKPGPADPTGKWVNWTPFTYPFNLTQQPAASVPCGFVASGLPAGLQIVGRMYDDLTVLRIARAYEKATKFYKKRAPGF